MLADILEIIAQRASKTTNIKKYWIDCTFVYYVCYKKSYEF